MPIARVALAQPLLLGPSLRSGQAFRWKPLPDRDAFAGVAEGRAWTLAREDGALRVEAEPSMAPAEAAAWARRYFRLDDPYDAIAARLAREAALAPAVEAWRGLRLLQTDPWECLLGFVTSIHDSVAAIETRMGRLCRHFGAPLRTTLPGFPRGWAYATPSPERIARAHEARLRSAAGMGFRARYLRGAARMVVEGDVPLADLPRMRYEEAHEVLLQLPGVGDKVADCVQLYSLGHLESFPVDRWIHRAMLARYFADAPRTNAREITALAHQRWGRDAGYAQQFLFHDARVAGSPAAARDRAARAAA
ncbi:MAG TPA: DNA glycosylase [Candidatus Thermoplasmatota archaeon]|nr:DNA glycosylase [Candidatus Thermoplasmatota archaeon]